MGHPANPAAAPGPVAPGQGVFVVNLEALPTCRKMQLVRASSIQVVGLVQAAVR